VAGTVDQELQAMIAGDRQGPQFAGARPDRFEGQAQPASAEFEPGGNGAEPAGSEPVPADERPERGRSSGASTLTPFTEIEAKPVKFAWRDRVALGKITALAGRPKIGKGLLWANLIAEVTRGTLDGDLDGPQPVIIVTTEDEPGDTLKPRLIAAGADLSLVSYFTMGSAEEPVPFRVPQDAEELGRRVAETGAALVVIDPLIEFIDGKSDTHKSQPVRQAIASLNAIAREHGCAILAILHLNKGASTDPLLRHEGAAAFTQVVRASLMLGFDPDDPEGEESDQRVLAVSASNLARLAPSLAYRIEGATVQGDTGGETINTARIFEIGESGAASHHLLAGREDEEARADRDEAVEFLRVELADGPRPAGEIKAAAKTAAITDWALRKAKAKLGVDRAKDGMKGPWMWILPEGETPRLPPPSVRIPPLHPLRLLEPNPRLAFRAVFAKGRALPMHPLRHLRRR
jgi:hypothetical protein